MAIDVNLTTVISSAVVAVIVGGSQFIANRYLAKMLDRIDKKLTNSKNCKKE
jgi:hypothetical protein